jgi:NAD-dependent deacetylase
MKKLVVLSGAGVSAESGIPTFRDSNGLWEGHDVMEVASPEGWKKDRELVLEFYNLRRRKALEVKPNRGHIALAELEEHFDVQIITQNIDNLHEQAGSTNVIHLHGEISKSRSTVDPELVYDIDGWELKEGDKCEKGSQLRPHIVWFGEAVPMIEVAQQITVQADLFAVVGTSMAVYPAAGLIYCLEADVPKYIIDPKRPNVEPIPNLHFIEEVGSTGLDKLKTILLENNAT